MKKLNIGLPGWLLLSINGLLLAYIIMRLIVIFEVSATTVFMGLQTLFAGLLLWFIVRQTRIIDKQADISENMTIQASVTDAYERCRDSLSFYHWALDKGGISTRTLDGYLVDAASAKGEAIALETMLSARRKRDASEVTKSKIIEEVTKAVLNLYDRELETMLSARIEYNMSEVEKSKITEEISKAMKEKVSKTIKDFIDQALIRKKENSEDTPQENEGEA